MRAPIIAPALFLALAASTGYAHGPQIQITRVDNKITTRRIFLNEPYTTKLTVPTSVYVIPLLEAENVWYSRPNNTPSDTVPGAPEFISGPGIAYGYDQVDGGPRDFDSGEHFNLNFIDGLLWWNGLAFEDPGLEEIEAFRSSGSAITSDSLTPASPAAMPYSNLSATYSGSSHSSASFRMLGDGSSPTVEGDDGVYLLSMTYSSTEPGLAASDPFYFVLHKNASSTEIDAAVGSLGIARSRVQYVPEPGAALLLAVGAICLASNRRIGKRRRSARQ